MTSRRALWAGDLARWASSRVFAACRRYSASLLMHLSSPSSRRFQRAPDARFQGSPKLQEKHRNFGCRCALAYQHGVPPFPGRARCPQNSSMSSPASACGGPKKLRRKMTGVISSKWPRPGFTRLPSFANLAITLSRCPRHGPHAEKATVPGTFGFGLVNTHIREGVGGARCLMPSARYYREQAKALLSWARATKDSGYADRLRARAAEELEQAELAREAVADLTPLLMEFNSQRLNSRVHQQGTQMPRPEPVRALQDLLAVIGSPDEIAPMDTLHFGRKLADVITGACTRGSSREFA